MIRSILSLYSPLSFRGVCTRLGCLLAVAGVMVIAGCSFEPSQSPAGDSKAVEPQVLHVGNGAEPQELDPHIITGVPEHRITSTLFEGLVDVDPTTLDPIPAVAQSWDVSEDKRTYTFHLRPEAKWSNGEPVIASDFAYAWERILTPALASEYAYMLHCLENAEAFHKGEITDFAQVGVKALDDQTLEVHLIAPTPYFLSMQTHYTWYPVHRATIEAFGGMTDRGTKWTRPGNFVGNGPFALKRWEPNRVIEVVKNSHYWDGANVRLDAIEFHPIEDHQTEERSFRAGQLHLTETLPLVKVASYQKKGSDALHIDPYLGTYFYRFNVTKPPFDDARVRRALAMSIDRASVVRNVLKGGQEPANFYTPPKTKGYTSTTAIPHDIEAAKALLAEAGYPNGEGFPVTEVLYNTSENHRVIAEALQQMWKKHLNIEIRLANQDWKVYLDSMNRLDYQMARSSWIGDYVDPMNFLECFTSGNGNNRTGYSSPEYDALIDQARLCTDEGARLDLFQQAEAILMADAPVMPIYFYTRIYLKAPEVKGWYTNPLGYISFKRIYLDSTEG